MDLGECRNYLTARSKKNLRSQGGPTPKNCAFLGQFRQKILFFFYAKKILFSLISLYFGVWGRVFLRTSTSSEYLKGLLNQCIEGFLKQGQQKALRIAHTECASCLRFSLDQRSWSMMPSGSGTTDPTSEKIFMRLLRRSLWAFWHSSEEVIGV